MRLAALALGGAFLAMLEGVAGGPWTAGQLSRQLPSDLPDMTGWERVSGSAELTDPPRRLRYEFYVHPSRLARYEVIRYTLSSPPNRHAAGDPGAEKLQWQVSDRELRRYVCEPLGRGQPCRWREMEKDSAEYAREMEVILMVLGVHRRLLWERENGRLN